MSPPRCAFVLGRFPPPLDGQSLATEACADALAEAFDVRRYNTEPARPGPATATPQFRLDRTAHYLALVPRLAAALRQAPKCPVLWHAISPAPLGHFRDVLATVPAFAPGQPVAGVLHRALFERLFVHRATRLSALRLVKRLDALVFQSSRLAARASLFVPPAKLHVIPNPVAAALLCDPVEVDAKRRAYVARRGAGEPIRILFLSNMLPEKGYWDVLEAAVRLRAHGFSFQLDLAGRWPSTAERVAAEQFIEAGGLGRTVRVLGGVTQAEAQRLHLAADLFVLPTYHPTETQPIAVLEALGAGTPVISLRRDVMEDILQDGVEGALVPERDGAAIAAAVRRLAEPDTWTRASAAARSRFDATFSPERIAQAWRDLAAALADMGRRR